MEFFPGNKDDNFNGSPGTVSILGVVLKYPSAVPLFLLPIEAFKRRSTFKRFIGTMFRLEFKSTRL